MGLEDRRGKEREGQMKEKKQMHRNGLGGKQRWGVRRGEERKNEEKRKKKVRRGEGWT